MSINLTDTQLVMLSAAAQREDRCLVASQNLKGGAAQKVAAKLIATGLVKEIRANTGTPVWRRDVQAGQSYALRLTAAGARAIAIDEGSASDEGREDGGQREQGATTDSRIVRQFLRRTLPQACPRREAERSWRRSLNCCSAILAQRLTSLSRRRAGFRIPRAPRLPAYASAGMR